MLVLSSCPPFYSVQDPSPSTSMNLPTLVNLIQTPPYGYAQRCVSCVVLDSVMLTVNFNHHSGGWDQGKRGNQREKMQCVKEKQVVLLRGEMGRGLKEAAAETGA